MLVEPVYVFTPVKVVVPEPDWITAPVPETTPLTVKAPAWVKFKAPVLLTALPNVAPVASFNNTTAPLDTFTVPVDARLPALPLPTCKVPDVTLVEPA